MSIAQRFKRVLRLEEMVMKPNVILYQQHE
jgi:hypothetical protein